MTEALLTVGRIRENITARGAYGMHPEREFMKATAETTQDHFTEGVKQEDCFPTDVSWLAHLSESSLSAFLSEFEALARAKNWAGLSQMVAEWKDTAEICADPELFAELTREIQVDSFEPVPRP